MPSSNPCFPHPLTVFGRIFLLEYLGAAVKSCAPIFLVLLHFGLGLMCGQAVAQVPEEKPLPRVLLLYSNDRLLPAGVRLDAGFRDTLGQVLGGHYELYTEFLDAVRFPGEARQDAMAEALRIRYQERPPQVLVAAGPEALTFFQNRRDSLFPGTPLVFGGIRVRDKAPDFIEQGVAGVPLSLEIAPTLEVALRLRPQTREVVVVTGSSKLDREWDALARKDFQPFESRVKVTYWNELPFAELTRRIGTLPPETVVFYLTYFQEPNGTNLSSSAHALELLAARSSVPIFGPYDTYIGRGIVGGLMTDFAGEGKSMARLVQRVLAGELPEEIGIQPPRPGFFHFDARQFKRWRISTRDLPAESVVEFQSLSLWQEHPRAIIAVMAVIALQSVLIAIMLIHRARHLRAEAALAESTRNLAHASRLALVGELTASIAHEINQPLGAILSNAEAAELLIERGSLDEVRCILADIRKDDLRASKVIQQVRDLVGKCPPQIASLRMNEVVAEALHLASADARRRGVTIESDLADGLPEIEGELVQFKQLLLNLILNGMDAMASKPPAQRRIIVRTACENGRTVEISVSDAGQGIASAHLPHLFESFFTTKEHGMGLGLAMVRSIAEAHRGTVSAENNVNGGATFRLRIPVNGTPTV